MWALAITIVLVPITVVYLFLKFVRGNQDYWTQRGVPISQAKLTFRERLTRPFHEVDQAMYESVKSQNVTNYFGVVELRKPMLFVLDPELIKSILVKDFNTFTNRRMLGLGKSDKFFQNMLFFMEDQPWKEMRSTISPTFSTGKIKAMNDLFNESGEKVVNYLARQVNEKCKSNNSAEDIDDGIEIDMQNVFGRYTLDVIASVAFGVDSENFSQPNSAFYQMGQRINMAAAMSLSLMLKFLTLVTAPKLFEWLNLSLSDKTALQFFMNVVEKSIQQREAQEVEKRKDFLQLMIDAKHGILEKDADENEVSLQPSSRGATLTNDSILGNCVLFFIAGFDTSESLLTFTAYELAINPEIQERLYDEVDNTMDKYGGKFTYEAIASMNYLDMVISEALRKYPPAFRLERRADTNYNLPNSDVTLEKGSLAIIPIYCIQHDPDIYPNPEQFIPERFTAESKSQRHPYTYLPFGTGPRSCIAMRFALTEVKSAVAHLVHQFRFEPTSRTPIPVTFKKSASALKPAEGLYLKVKARQ